ncbi:MAG TPA: fluoride efflux transporter CrcB [Nocardioidaceae bacterium]|nr:fluoride efflux transporter CrcB [Nocardioidaceae bacterium]
MSVVLVLIGGAVGAPLRYLTDLLVQARHDSILPWGTLTVNVAGSFVLGAVGAAVAVAGAPSWAMTLLGTGFCGALTTFSTFGFETVRLLEEGSLLEAFVNVLASLVAGLVAVTAGWALVTVL